MSAVIYSLVAELCQWIVIFILMTQVWTLQREVAP